VYEEEEKLRLKGEGFMDVLYLEFRLMHRLQTVIEQLRQPCNLSL
jgi:hypothetical protein